MATFASRFKRSEVIGFFDWSSELTAVLKACGIVHLFHALHDDDVPALRAVEGFMSPRSEVNARADDGTLNDFTGLWVSPIPWHDTHGHNFCGPITYRFPMRRIEGRRFILLRRTIKGSGWVRYFFVEAKRSREVFGDKQKSYRIDPLDYFTASGDGYRLTRFVNYEFVLTTPVTLRGATIIPNAHRTCFSRGCPPMDADAASLLVDQLFVGELAKLMKRYPERDYRKLLRDAATAAGIWIPKGVKLRPPKRS